MTRMNKGWILLAMLYTATIISLVCVYERELCKGVEWVGRFIR